MVSTREDNKLQIEPPKNCPSCNSTLVWSKDQLYCKNAECPAKSGKQIEHFAKTLKIKGLGPAAIEKLEISSILEIYDMNLEYITMQLGSERLASKLFDEIEKSKKEPLDTVLPAFGIPLVGKSASDKLSSVVETIFDVDEAACKTANIGPAATGNLIAWLDTQFEKFSVLPFSFEFAKNTKTAESRGVVCITGKLSSFSTKAEATEILKSLGYTVKSSLTKDVTILVNESGVETAKTIKASNDGVEIVTNLKEYIGE